MYMYCRFVGVLDGIIEANGPETHCSTECGRWARRDPRIGSGAVTAHQHHGGRGKRIRRCFDIIVTHSCPSTFNLKGSALKP
jgi:hypothetical protein